MTCNTDKWDKININRNDLMHGKYERETTEKDCIMLYLLFLDFKEISYMIQRIDDLNEKIEILNNVNNVYNI